MKKGTAISAGYHSRQAPPLCFNFTPISFSFLQLSSFSAHPSSSWFTPLILNCLSFLRLEKLTLDTQSALTEQTWVQWSSVAFCAPLCKRNTYNSSELSTPWLWICQNCTEDLINIQWVAVVLICFMSTANLLFRDKLIIDIHVSRYILYIIVTV